MTTLVLDYTVNPIWSALKTFVNALIKSQEIAGRARAAHHLSAMGYHEEAKQIMLIDK